MITIWKYPVSLEDSFEVEMPEAAYILAVQMQGDTPQMWAIVDTNRPRKKFTFRLFGTGHPMEHTTAWGKKSRIPDWLVDYRGTFQIRGLVFHLFMMPPHIGADDS